MLRYLKPTELMPITYPRWQTLLHFLGSSRRVVLTWPSRSSTFAVRSKPSSTLCDVHVSGTNSTKSTLSPWIQIRTGNVTGRNSLNGRSKERSNSSPQNAMCAEKLLRSENIWRFRFRVTPHFVIRSEGRKEQLQRLEYKNSLHLQFSWFVDEQSIQLYLLHCVIISNSFRIRLNFHV